jgi:hypothetical protein
MSPGADAAVDAVVEVVEVVEVAEVVEGGVAASATLTVPGVQAMTMLSFGGHLRCCCYCCQH